MDGQRLNVLIWLKLMSQEFWYNCVENCLRLRVKILQEEKKGKILVRFWSWVHYRNLECQALLKVNKASFFVLVNNHSIFSIE